ncbi:hypothetical protein [Deinococcus sp.]|uniref:hypothetical protein n=1 Tax=Deinococcus sp. TaxID=47478 RepID=UPI003B5C0A71
MIWAILDIFLGLALLFYLLSRKNLLAGDTLFTSLTLLACLIVVPGVLFVVFTVIAYSFKGRAFELSISGLVFAVGLALTLLGWYMTSYGRVAALSLMVGVIVMTFAVLTVLP